MMIDNTRHVSFEPGPIGADINMIKWNGDTTKLPYWDDKKIIGWTGGDSVELILERISNLLDEIYKKADYLLRDSDGDYNASELFKAGGVDEEWFYRSDDKSFEERSPFLKELIEAEKTGK